MCKKGNQTISKACLGTIWQKHPELRTNKELREVLRKNGGCMVQSPK